MRSRPVLISAILAVMAFATSAAGAQNTEPKPVSEGRLEVVDAQIEGSGPWTSLFGAAPNRALSFTVANIGQVTVDNPELVLTVGKGSGPTDFLASPEIGRLEPGESTSVRVELDLPTFAIDTYAVEGSFPEFEPSATFRTETSHIPRLLLVAPLLILLQLGLIAVRNRVRRRLHRPFGATVQADEPAVIDLRADELETIIGDELGWVFDDAFSNHAGSISDADFHDLIVELTRTAYGRVAARTELTEPERAALELEMAEAVLGAFDLTPTATV